MNRHLLRISALALLSGCAAIASPQGVGGPSGGEPENTTPPVNALQITGHPGLEGCGGANVEQELEIAVAFDQSIHELVVCGGMAARLSVSFLDVLVNAALGLEPSSDGWTYMGEGRWETGEGMMSAWFVLPFDTSWGRAGEVIPFDVLDPESYFTGISVVASATIDTSGEARTDLLVEFTEPAPGFELLGVSSTPGESSIRLDFDALVERLGAIRMKQDVVVEDERDSVSVYYHVTNDGVPLRNLVFAAGASDMQIQGAWAEHHGTGQRLTVTDWGMAYGGGSAGTLDGSLDIVVTGGGFDYEAHFGFPHRRYPDVTLACH